MGGETLPHNRVPFLLPAPQLNQHRNGKSQEIFMNRQLTMVITLFFVLLGPLASLGLAAPQSPSATRAWAIQVDEDHDGLDYTLEQLLNINPIVADSDGDGWSDSEEIARHTDPRLNNSYPNAANNGISSQIVVRLEGTLGSGILKVFALVYLPPGEENGKTFQFVDLQNGQLHYFSPLETGNTLQTLAAHDSGAHMVVVGIDLPDTILAITNTYLLAVVVKDLGHSVQASSYGLRSLDGWPVQLFPIVFPSTSAPSTGGSNFTLGCARQGDDRAQQFTPTSGSSAGSLYLPLTSDPAPTTWVAEQICVQHTAPIGTSGNMIIEEIVASACESGWDAYCPPSCASSVGTTFESIDPVLLIGG